MYSITNNKNESINVLGIDHKLVRVKKGTLYEYEEEIDDDASWTVPRKNFYIYSRFEDIQLATTMMNTKTIMHIENSIIKIPDEKTKISVDNKITFDILYNDKGSIGKDTIYSLPYKKKTFFGRQQHYFTLGRYYKNIEKYKPPNWDNNTTKALMFRKEETRDGQPIIHNAYIYSYESNRVPYKSISYMLVTQNTSYGFTTETEENDIQNVPSELYKNDNRDIEDNITLEPNKTVGGKKHHKWSAKYKKSINCNRPKGFSQRQHCKYGRKKTRKNRR